MKAAILALFLAGCGSIGNTVFDPVEASRYVDVITTAKYIQSQCDSIQVAAEFSGILVSTAEMAASYSGIKQNNSRITNAGKELLNLTKELNTRLELRGASSTYCKIKLAQIKIAAEAIARSIGKKELISPVAITEDK